MKIAVRILFAFISFFSTYYFIFWVPFALIPPTFTVPLVRILVALVTSIIASLFIWKKMDKMSNELSTYIILGGIILGSTGFIIGFVAPIIFTPSSNQGPLLGIFITGPIGFLIGLIGGGLYWFFKVKSLTKK